MLHGHISWRYLFPHSDHKVVLFVLLLVAVAEYSKLAISEKCNVTPLYKRQ